VSKLLHIKGSRNQILKTLPSNDIGNDGDIVVSAIQGKGIYLCIKANNRWYVSNKLEELRKIEKTSIKDLNVNRLKVGNTTITKDEYDVGKGDFTIDVNGEIILDAKCGSGKGILLKNSGTKYGMFDIHHSTTFFTLYENGGASTDDYLDVSVGANGASIISTVDAAGTAANLTLDPDGDLLFSGCDVKIDSTEKLYLDGGGDTYIYEQSADNFRVVVGGDVIMHISENGDDGNEINFGSTCVGFTQLEPTYDASNTEVDFRFSNKQFLTFGAGSITNLKLTFPLVSGNFVLLVKQDGIGSKTITNYKAFEFDESAADGSAAVKFAGGSNPTLTTDANHVDILSFYWDADNEIAYGVATLDFQF